MTLSITCYSKCQPCHVERSETSFALFCPLSFLSLCSSDFVDCDRVFLLFGTLSFRPSLSLSFRPSAPHCHVERSETSFTPFRPLSFRPSGASGEICMLCAAPSSEYTVSDDYSAGAAGSSALKGSPRAWLLPFSPLLCIRTCAKGCGFCFLCT